jgi:hypothetical protein
MRLETATTDAWLRFLDHPAEGDVPTPIRSASSFSKLLADHAIVRGMEFASPEFWIKDGEVKPEIVEELADIRAFQRIEGWDKDPFSFHQTPPQLNNVRIESSRIWGQRYEHLQWDSEYVPHPDDPARARWQDYQDNHTGHAWMLRNQYDSNAPWVVCVHAYAMGHPGIDLMAFRARELRRRHGVNVVSYVLPLHGPRLGGASQFESFLHGVGNLIHMEAQAIWDLRRLIGWLRRDGAPWIGVQGLSLGGYTTALLGAFEEDLAFAVAGIPAVDFSDLLRSNIKEPDEQLDSFWSEVTKALRVVGPLALEPALPRNRRFIFAGLLDRMTPPRSVRELWLHWDQPRIEWYSGSHVSFFLEPRAKNLVDDAIVLADRRAKAC